MKILTALIGLYRMAVSPWLPPACRFEPSCSLYSQEALLMYGIRGLWMTLRRLSRCHPLGSSGYDPVPPTPFLKEAGTLGLRPGPRPVAFIG